MSGKASAWIQVIGALGHQTVWEVSVEYVPHSLLCRLRLRRRASLIAPRGLSGCCNNILGIDSGANNVRGQSDRQRCQAL